MPSPSVTASRYDGDVRSPLSPHYYRFLSDHGPGFRETLHVIGAIADPTRLGALLVEAIRLATTAADGSPRFRAFKGHSLDYRLTTHLAHNHTDDFRSASDWLASASDGEACLAFNEVAQWSVSLGSWYADRVNELVAVAGYEPTRALGTYTFVNAGTGWTPFGIHNDYEPSFIFHLGPGSKTAWVWPLGHPADAILAPSPGLNGISLDIRGHLESAMQFVLAPGDFLCIPADYYHVFESRAHSAMLGLTLYPSNPGHLLTNVLTKLLAEHSAATSSAVGNDPISVAADVARRLALEMPSISHRVAGQLQKLKSAGYTAIPHRQALSALTKPTREGTYSTRFRGVFQPMDQTGGIYAFGRELKLNTSVEPSRVCSVLNNVHRDDVAGIAKRLHLPPDEAAPIVLRAALLGALVQ